MRRLSFPLLETIRRLMAGGGRTLRAAAGQAAGDTRRLRLGGAFEDAPIKRLARVQTPAAFGGVCCIASLIVCIRCNFLPGNALKACFAIDFVCIYLLFV